MATQNPTWGEERIADELLLKIGIRISPRTVRRYMPEAPLRPADPKQRWMTFVHNHAKAIIASDFFVVVTFSRTTSQPTPMPAIDHKQVEELNARSRKYNLPRASAR